MLLGRLPLPTRAAMLRRSPPMNSGKLTLSTGSLAKPPLTVPFAVPNVALKEKDSTSGTCKVSPVDHTLCTWKEALLSMIPQVGIE